MAFRFSSVIALFCVLSIWGFAFTAVESATRQDAPAPASDCNSLVLNLVDCLSFVQNGSTETKPVGTCCSNLKMVLKTDAQCLCEGFKNSAQMGIALNFTKAMTLPAACHLSAPSVSNCGLGTGTGAAPALSPFAVSPSMAPAGAPAAAAASEVAPAPAPGKSSSTSLSRSVGPLTLTLAVAIISLF